MKSVKAQSVVLLLIAGLLTACASPATQAPASQPTEAASTATDVPTAAPTAAAESSPTSESAPAGATVSFANDILPIIQSRCINCHGGDRTEEGLSLKDHVTLMTGSENGPVIIPGDAANSLLAEMVLEQKMPKRGPKLTPPQVQLIIDWINQGALNN